MKTLLHTEFAALLARNGVSQAAFARLTGLTPRQVNNWCRGRAVVPRWAAVLAVLLEERSPEALSLALEEAAFTWQETLGLPPAADATSIRRPCPAGARLRSGQRRHPGADGPRQRRLRAGAGQPGAPPADREAPSPSLTGYRLQ